MMGEIAKREQELFMKYLKESPELWQQLMESIEYGNSMSRCALLQNIKFQLLLGHKIYNILFDM